MGVMGKGIALEFKKRYPGMYYDYLTRCSKREIEPGGILAYRKEDVHILNAVTKYKWQEPSKYLWIALIACGLKHYLSIHPDKKVALPALGCGNGGLKYEVVKEIIIDELNDSCADILLFPPWSK